MVSHPNPRLGVITRFVCALMYAMICFIARPSISLSPIFGPNFAGESFPTPRPAHRGNILAGVSSALFVQFAANYLNSPPSHLSSRRLIFGGICDWVLSSPGTLFVFSSKIDILALTRIYSSV